MIPAVSPDPVDASLPPAAETRLPDALQHLRDQVAAVSLALETPEAGEARRSARAVVDQVDDYLLPRLRDLDAPLLTVVGGSTGAGKSTLVNSVLGAQVTTSGVLRPTTRAPVLVCATADRAYFAGDRVLPSLARVTGAGGDAGVGALRLLPRDDLPAGLALLVAPDVDSVVEANRELAGQLLAAADLWVFVTTASRYADAVPWDLLRTAQERGTALAVVLDRVPSEAVGEVAEDLAGMLERGGLSQARLFVVEERPLVDGLLPEDQIAPLRSWLHGLAADQGQRAAVVRQTLAGALDSLGSRVDGLVVAVDAQDSAATALQSSADAAYDAARIDPAFIEEVNRDLAHYVGRPSPIYHAERLSKAVGGARILLKREDLNHTGAHKINNTIGQALLASRMGKTRIIAETGAGQHGVASATVAARLGLECVVYMGATDIERQKINVYRMQLLGATVVPVTSGSATLKDALNEAMRD